MADGVPDRLRRILDYKKDEVRALRAERSLASLEADAKEQSPPRDFAGSLLSIARSGGNALICEMKRKSPSAGAINTARAPAEAARAYQAGGAACISVLTDGPSFGGEIADLTEVRSSVSLPVIRKDFMIDPIQIVQSRAIGADAILIIMAAVDDACARDLHAAADALGLAVLLEAHDESELERALAQPSPLVGVNNRDLRRIVTDLGVSERLSALIPADRLLISESGVASPADIVRLRGCGARSFLIGEVLMRAEDPEAAVRALVEAR